MSDTDLSKDSPIWRKQCGIALLIGAALTLIWLLVCPKYKIHGDVSTVSTYQHRSGGGWRHADFQHLDAALFFGGVIIIWTAIAGICLLAPNLRRWWANLEVGGGRAGL